MFDPGNLEPMISVWYYLSFKIDSVFNENIDIPTKYKYLEKVIEYIEVEILNLKSNSSNKFYHMILDYFFEKIEGAFRDKYALVYELFSSTETYDDKVKFNLTQEQLAAFTYLIANSGMLNNEITKEKFYYFCERHFYYLSRDGKTYKPLQQAAKKATKRYDGKEPPVKVVFDKIESVYDENLTK